jgi:Leucine-rich repeat (LRR) protein
LRALPDSIGDLVSLNTLLVHGNDLERVPSLAKCLSVLEFVTLHDNPRLLPDKLQKTAESHDVGAILDVLKGFE